MNIHNVLLPGKKGAFYGRHSTEEQTIDTQLHWANELAKEFGCEIIKEFVDIGVSAVKKNMSKRKGLTALMTYLETAEIDFVIIYDHTRLARNAMEHQKIRGFFNSKKIPVVMCSTRDMYNSGDLLGELLKDGYSKYEADAIRQRTEDNHYKKIKEGIYRGGKLPFGYKFSPDDYIFKVLPDEKEIVDDIFQKYQEGEGFHAIALSLKKQSFHGRDWTKDDVKLIITNPFYAGYLTAKRFHPNSHRQLTDKEEWIMGYCERITPFIRYEVWEYCYETYRSKRKGNVSPKNFKTPFLLRDILFCKNCKTPLKCKNQKNKYHGKPNGNSIYYCENKACSLRLEKNKVHEKFIEEEMSAVLIKYISTQHKDIHEEILINLKQKVDKLSQQIIELEIMIDEFTLQIRRTEAELHSLDPNKPQELKNSFLRYRILLKEKINNTQQLINEKKLKISYIENVESDFLLMKGLLVDTILLEYNGEIDPRLRRLLLYLFERIEIGPDLVYDVTARIDLENDTPVVLSGFIT
ncbi:recombinase family protein [Paenibacillus sp. B2(2019)]|uniref:recombinase family protein n=1 Tax=Paenibacillus sp. B2(2019) TaxID=2607754 RepID=UPI0011F35045|nr:recombinase family protein [Paenibacillus sp. B2(2019)]KAA1186172.1 recombinase family protein [Paenibacillus sp. B2(2019)]